MKTLFILFVGILGYVHCDPHECDGYAANIKRKPDDSNAKRTGLDKYNQLVDIGPLLKHDTAELFIARASYRNDLDEKPNKYCIAGIFGRHCGAVKYVRKVTLGKELKDDPTYNFYDKTLKGNVSMAVEVLSFSVKTGNIVRIYHTAQLINEDDLIFQPDHTSFEITDAITGVELRNDDIDEKTRQEISQPFAMNRIIFDEETNAISAVISFSCDRKWVWATYAAHVVKENKEGKYAKEIERLLFELDVKHNETIKNDPKVKAADKKSPYDFQQVKPFSTAFPKDIHYKKITV